MADWHYFVIKLSYPLSRLAAVGMVIFPSQLDGGTTGARWPLAVRVDATLRFHADRASELAIEPFYRASGPAAGNTVALAPHRQAW